MPRKPYAQAPAQKSIVTIDAGPPQGAPAYIIFLDFESEFRRADGRHAKAEKHDKCRRTTFQQGVQMIQSIRKPFRSQLGQGMTEYIIIVALIAIAAIGVYSFFGQTIRGQTAGMASAMSGG